jgi:hypothetical protein
VPTSLRCVLESCRPLRSRRRSRASSVLPESLSPWPPGDEVASFESDRIWFFGNGPDGARREVLLALPSSARGQTVYSCPGRTSTQSILGASLMGRAATGFMVVPTARRSGPWSAHGDRMSRPSPQTLTTQEQAALLRRRGHVLRAPAGSRREPGHDTATYGSPARSPHESIVASANSSRGSKRRSAAGHARCGIHAPAVVEGDARLRSAGERKIPRGGGPSRAMPATEGPSRLPLRVGGL